MYKQYLRMPEGFYGIQCYQQYKPKAIIIDSVIVHEFPAYYLTTSSNDTIYWDDDHTAPDIYVKLLRGNDTATQLAHFHTIVYKNQEIVSDALSHRSYTFIPNEKMSIDRVISKHAMTIWDYDESSSDSMIGGIIFTPNEDKNALPKRFELLSIIGGLSIEMYVTYEFE